VLFDEIVNLNSGLVLDNGKKRFLFEVW